MTNVVKGITSVSYKYNLLTQKQQGHEILTAKSQLLYILLDNWKRQLKYTLLPFINRSSSFTVKFTGLQVESAFHSSGLK